MHIKRIVGPLGLMSRVAQQQEQLWSDPWQEPHQLCSAALGVFLRTIPQHSLSGRQTLEAQTHGLGDGSQRPRCWQSCREQRCERLQLTAQRR